MIPRLSDHPPLMTIFPGTSSFYMCPGFCVHLLDQTTAAILRQNMVFLDVIGDHFFSNQCYLSGFDCYPEKIGQNILCFATID